MPPPPPAEQGPDVAPSFGEATAVTALTSHTYRAQLRPEWAVGSVPHGGVVTAVLLRAAALHFATTLAAQRQPHAITLHAEFLRRTACGPATLTVRDVKLGRQTSTVHVALAQAGRRGEGEAEETDEVVAYITHTDLAAEAGPSFATGWALDPPPPPPLPPALRAGDGDAHWALWRDRPFPHFRRVMSRVDVFLPRAGQARDSLCDEWLRLRAGERFDDASLGLVSDLWPQLIESLAAARRRRGTGDGNDPAAATAPSPPPPPPLAMYWYPTLLLNLDIKKALPPGGAAWLFARVRAKQIRNGRQDLEVVILDEAGDIVALSHHVALVLDAKRNTAKRRVAGAGSKM